MADVVFEVEFVHVLRGRARVFARQVAGGAWRLGVEPTLGGRGIRRSASNPRALAPDGAPRLDLFVFELVHRDDVEAFAVGQRVELCEGDA